MAVLARHVHTAESDGVGGQLFERRAYEGGEDCLPSAAGRHVSSGADAQVPAVAAEFAARGVDVLAACLGNGAACGDDDVDKAALADEARGPLDGLFHLLAVVVVGVEITLLVV